VIQVQPLRTSEVGRYAHKVNQHAVVRPYRAVLRLTGVAGDRVVQAIGQSRHLGGGLLVPRDVPAAALAAAAPSGRP
jgi:CRISPR-associated protein Csb2